MISPRILFRCSASSPRFSTFHFTSYGYETLQSVVVKSSPLFGSSKHLFLSISRSDAVRHPFCETLQSITSDRRISDLDTLNTELTAWQHATNTEQRKVRWQFTTDDARVKLRHLYPKS